MVSDFSCEANTSVWRWPRNPLNRRRLRHCGRNLGDLGLTRKTRIKWETGKTKKNNRCMTRKKFSEKILKMRPWTYVRVQRIIIRECASLPPVSLYLINRSKATTPDESLSKLQLGQNSSVEKSRQRRSQQKLQEAHTADASENDDFFHLCRKEQFHNRQKFSKERNRLWMEVIGPTVSVLAPFALFQRE